jgi:hypothetical protein
LQSCPFPEIVCFDSLLLLVKSAIFRF